MNLKISSTRMAAQSVMRAGGEHYHFYMACKEHGEREVQDAMRDEIHAGGNVPWEDANFAAAAEFRMMKRLEYGQERFKKIRRSLAANKTIDDFTSTTATMAY